MESRFVKQYFPPGPYSRARLGVFLTPIIITIVLLLLDEYGIQAEFYRKFIGHFPYQGIKQEELALYSQLHFSVACFALFVLVPVLFHLAFPDGNPNPFGLRIREAIPHLPMYFILIAIMLPVVWLVSSNDQFQSFYPMYKPTALKTLVLYEVVYMLQFFTVEFFFRGFALFRLERLLGQYSVVLMAIPYGLLHIYKPFPEALGSIAAALILGTLALRGRSIWPGVAVHCSVALSMDLSALTRSGRLAELF